MLVNDLRDKAKQIRRISLETALKAKKGHVPPAFSWADIGVALYYGGILRVRPNEPKWPERDQFILSKGHACLTLYAILADLGFFPKSELDTFATGNAMLAGHPEPHIPGVDAISGSLGHGLGFAAGMAMAAKIDGRPQRFFTVLGDGECQEGSIWEAAMFAGQHKLSNMIAILDNNKLSATDFVKNIVSIEPVVDHFRDCGWEAERIDGHDFDKIFAALSPTRLDKLQKPLMIVADTIKGRGVDFMENSPQWHHQMPKGEQIDRALAQLS
ncbi:MAG TPA: transketolase [Alphaproteobacteria bacterium]|nr:transketolase [Alphaproteobacteria bacterium]